MKILLTIFLKMKLHFETTHNIELGLLVNLAFLMNSEIFETLLLCTVKGGQFYIVYQMVNKQFKAFSINLKAQHVNGLTYFDFCCSL